MRYDRRLGLRARSNVGPRGDPPAGDATGGPPNSLSGMRWTVDSRRELAALGVLLGLILRASRWRRLEQGGQ